MSNLSLKPIARLLKWKDSVLFKRIETRQIARTFEEYPKIETEKPDTYWEDGEDLYTHSQLEHLQREIGFLRRRIKIYENSQALQDIVKERRRQIEDEQFTPEHDDIYRHSELSDAAGCYALFSDGSNPVAVDTYWPWDKCWWKPSSIQRRNLIKAAALIVARIEQIDRKGKT